MLSRLGFMQGRLTDLSDGRIQSFPWTNWKKEFSMAHSLGFGLMEWTIDYEDLHKNPIMTSEGRSDIFSISKKYSISIPSITCDCFMQYPFWKLSPNDAEPLKSDFFALCRSCSILGISELVIPLVDLGRIESYDQEQYLIEFLLDNGDYFAQLGLSIIFESDYPPSELTRFINYLPEDLFGINYDIGNSASLGYSPLHEISSYSHRIHNVHIKDRKFNGTTVPLGQGSADFESVFSLLAQHKYKGNFILQTARADDGDHCGVLEKYRDFSLSYIDKFFND